MFAELKSSTNLIAALATQLDVFPWYNESLCCTGTM